MSIIMATAFLLSSAYRLLRSSAVDGCRERAASSIGGGESTPPSPKRVEAPRPQKQEGAPEPP